MWTILFYTCLDTDRLRSCKNPIRVHVPHMYGLGLRMSHVERHQMSRLPSWPTKTSGKVRKPVMMQCDEARTETGPQGQLEEENARSRSPV